MPSPKSRSSRRLASYRPVLDGIIFGLALLGILTSIHLGIQQERGFDQGCFGFSASEQVEATFDCEAVTGSEASNLLGVSNTMWGLLFYIVVGLLTLLAALNVGGKVGSFKAARAIWILVGFLYSLYLVYYQFFGIGELCALCLTSAGITTVLFIVQGVDFSKPSPSKPEEAPRMGSPKPKRDLTYMGAAVVLLAVLVAADFAYFNSIETPQPVFANESDSPARAASELPGDPLGAASGECSFDPKKAWVQNYSDLVYFFDPTIGEPGSSVTVIEYFDPNCPSCAAIHPIMMEVARAKLDKALFVFKPFVLWPHSVAQSEALYAAAQDGKFFQMLEHQYAIQQPRTGLGEPQLRAIAEEIGMDPEVLMEGIERGLYRRTLAEQKDMAVEVGVTGTPAVLINGRFVENSSKTVECLKELIDLAAQS